jgi:hypothetical protein
MLAASTTACAQQPADESGTINGKPIPAKIFTVTRIQAINALRRDGKLAPDGTADEGAIAAKIQDEKCGLLRGDVAFEARSQAVTDFGVVPTEQDLAEAVRTLRTGDPVKEIAALHDRTTVILNALSAVYDKGMAPDDAYRQIVAGHGIPEDAWKAGVQTGSTAAGRAMIARALTVTPRMYAQGIPTEQRKLAVSMKLDVTVDQMIASSDPVFRANLDKWNANHLTSVKESLHAKRAKWWKARFAKLQIVLSDPSLATTCHLAQMTGAEAVGVLR